MEQSQVKCACVVICAMVLFFCQGTDCRVVYTHVGNWLLFILQKFLLAWYIYILQRYSGIHQECIHGGFLWLNN